MLRKLQIGVLGVANAEGKLWDLALQIGQRIAKQGWVLVCGGLSGVMEAAAKGASEAGGVVIGIVPGPATKEANPYVTHAIATNMGHARNVIIAHTGDAFVAIGCGEGTLSEIAVARKLGKTVVSLESWNVAGVVLVKNPQEAISALIDSQS